MKRNRTGRYETVSTAGGEHCRAFIPDSLPPNPPLFIDPPLQELIDQALLSVGRLDSVTALLPDPSLFLYMYVRKEALLSSQIEGTQSSLADLLMFENQHAPGVPLDDVQEVSSYVAAMSHGLARIHEGFPLSNRLFREIHGILLSKGRGGDRAPGEFRRSQNWVGGTRPGNAVFVPPPHEAVAETMSDLEKFLHDQPVRTPPLVKAALAHVQLETIHPFLDGNGRLGRLMITFLLCAEGLLSAPLLYLSLYFKVHREQYYDLLQMVRAEGDWEAWLTFFMKGVRETAEKAVETVKRLTDLFEADRAKVEALGGRAANSPLRVLESFRRYPLLSVADARARTNLSPPTALKAIRRLQSAGIVEEMTGRSRGQLFRYSKYMAILSEGTE
jgi:Fic family protein